jgi:exodeoxyribonuclease V
MQPNEDQAKAITGLTDHFLSGVAESRTLSGPAGTGKTFCMKQVKENCEEEGLSVAFTAPTNKATKVLRETIEDPDCKTIYSLLGLQLMANGEIKELKQRETRLPIEDYQAVVVDEGSMINKVLRGLIVKAMREHNIPIVYLGDKYQLPPVGEEYSPIWESPPDFELSKIMRFDNQILALSQILRKYVEMPIGNLELKTNNSNGEGVWRMKPLDMIEETRAAARDGRFSNGSHKAIAWRNVEVDKLNRLIRSAIPGLDLSLPFSKGDRVIAREPCIGKDKKIVLHTDDECTVMATVVAAHPYFPEYECFITDLETEDGDVVSIWTVTPNSKPFLDRELQKLAEDARKNPKNWRQFWALKEAFHNVVLGYAITAHRSQGSTYEHAFVNFADILSNPNRTEAAKCLYVACSRPAKRLTLGG